MKYYKNTCLFALACHFCDGYKALYSSVRVVNVVVLGLPPLDVCISAFLSIQTCLTLIELDSEEALSTCVPTNFLS